MPRNSHDGSKPPLGILVRRAITCERQEVRDEGPLKAYAYDRVDSVHLGRTTEPSLRDVGCCRRSPVCSSRGAARPTEGRARA